MESGETAPGKKIRTFIALRIPAEWHRKLGEVQQVLKKAAPGADIKWVIPENIHLTLRFVGYIDPSEAEPIKTRLQQVASRVPPFELTSSGLGYFPNCRNPRVIWAGLTERGELLRYLQSAVVQETGKFGEPPEEREFKAHLTLARVKHLSKENARALDAKLQKTQLELTPWKVTEVVFFQSHLSQAGPRYEPLATFPLAG